MVIPHISSVQQIADLFTKAMSRNRYDFLVSKLMLLDDLHQFKGECEESSDSSQPRTLGDTMGNPESLKD